MYVETNCSSNVIILYIHGTVYKRVLKFFQISREFTILNVEHYILNGSFYELANPLRN